MNRSEFLEVGMGIAINGPPPAERGVETLAPVFRAAFDAWLLQAEAWFPNIEFRVTETRRTLERQRWLYAQGREEPHLSNPRVTWTLDSRHRWGLAADLAMIRRSTGDAVWEISSWKWLYKTVPPARYGLRHLGPTEWVHLEFRWSDDAIAEAEVIGLIQL